MTFFEDFLSHTTKKPRRGTLLCFKKFPVSKKLWIRKMGWLEYHDFP